MIENDFNNAEAAEILEDARTAIKKTFKKKNATKGEKKYKSYRY